MEEKKWEALEYFNKIVEREQIREYNDSKGTIILKNGFIFQVSHMFNLFRDIWFAHTKAQLEPDEEKKKVLLNLSNNGVITNGFITLDLSAVSAMIGENQDDMMEFPIDRDEDEVIPDDIGFDKGDSSIGNFSSN